jgi:N utilization substance protein B
VSTGEGATGGGRPRAGTRRAAPKSARRKSREFALQGLYEWLLGGADAGVVDAHVREQDGFDKCDLAYFDLLLHGVIREAAAIDARIAAHIDRKAELLSPVEHAALMIGTFELMRSIEVPYKVAINEAVELAKSFGGTDGHKYVNGVLDKAAAELRRIEVDAARKARG